MGLTGHTQSDQTQVGIDYSTFINDYYISNLIKLINDGHTFISFLVISSGIEFLGKAISGRSLFASRHSCHDFNKALNEFTPLNKYSSLGLSTDKSGNDNSFYDIIRCGIVHSSTPKNGITLSDGSNNLPSIVGLKDLSRDFIDACTLLLNGSKRMGGNKTLADIICYIKA